MILETALAALLAGQGLDTASTIKFRANGCREASTWVYGATPSASRVLAVKAACGFERRA